MATFHRVEKSHREPLYRQLRFALQDDIASGKFRDGRLPSSRALAQELGISRNVVILAYQELIAEGYATSVPRSGIRVNPEMQEYLQSQPPRAPGEIVDGPDWQRLIRRPANDQLETVERPLDWDRYPYAFVGGQIDQTAFPARAWLRALGKALQSEHRQASLQDSQYADDPLLVEALRTDVLPARGISAVPDEILVVAGSQQGLSLLAAALVREGDLVVIEDPGYLDLAHIVLRRGGSLAPVPVDDAGLVVTACPPGPRLIYVTPSHQFPTNVTLSIARREHLLRNPSFGGSILIEDDYDSEYRYQGRPAPALKAMDTSGRVVYLGSFSKFLAPGLRLGFVVAAPELIASLRDRRRYALRHPSGHLQRALALLILSGDYARAVRRNRALLKTKWERMVEAAHEHLPCTFAVPTGGASLWVTGPAGTDASVIAGAARQRGVLIEPERGFRLHRRDGNHFRLAYSAIALESIAPGLQTLGAVIREAVDA